jgi:hypothetical protein
VLTDDQQRAQIQFGRFGEKNGARRWIFDQRCEVGRFLPPTLLALTALENNAVEGVVVRRLEVSSAEESIRVELVAQNHPSALQYLEALNTGSDQENTDLLWNLLRAEVEQTGQSVRATLAARQVTGLAGKPPN